ncbi:MAG TPA: SPOR domain-containing protein [Acidisarcina sp.]|nr:SPOR domain-containing protein [Acidisarcina sp.]
MNTIFETEEREDRQDSEFTLSTGTILGIFFGLVVVCGVFFGFGYSMGRRAAEAKAAAAQTAATTETAATTVTRPKPSALEVLPPQTQAATTPPDETAAPTPAAPAEDANSASVEPAAAPKPRPAPRLIAAAAPVTPPASRPASTAVQSPRAIARPVAQTQGQTQSMVQIAAVSHAEDADALVAALRKHGYVVSVRSEPQDKLMHVQIGPFGSHADAVAMRQKLLSDGYNAIIK